MPISPSPLEPTLGLQPPHKKAIMMVNGARGKIVSVKEGKESGLDPEAVRVSGGQEGGGAQSCAVPFAL